MRIFETIIQAIILAVVITLAPGCASASKAKDGNAALTEISLEEYYKNAKRYDGRKVTVRGHLVSQGEVLHLYESANRPLKVNAATMLIWDSTPITEDGLFEVTYESHRCTDKYVKITGILGMIPLVDIFGMIEISEIRVFQNGKFHGIGELCYSAN